MYIDTRTPSSSGRLRQAELGLELARLGRPPQGVAGVLPLHPHAHHALRPQQALLPAALQHPQPAVVDAEEVACRVVAHDGDERQILGAELPVHDLLERGLDAPPAPAEGLADLGVREVDGGGVDLMTMVESGRVVVMVDGRVGRSVGRSMVRASNPSNSIQ